jgi:DNA (cytosine-5)-methyltransferase 1
VTGRPMTFGSLFSGIGGIDLGLERAGMTCKWQAEVEPYCVAVLERHWPGVKRYGDVTTINWAEAEPVDLICGGFPCQPFSLAGKRRGAADERNLWPEMLRAVQVVRPHWVVGENVPGIGDYLGTICTDLEAEGYEVLPLELPAAAFGAPHLRYRLFIVAHSNGERRQQVAGGPHGDEGTHEGRTAPQGDLPDGGGEGHRAGTMADAEGARDRRLSDEWERSINPDTHVDGSGEDVPDAERGQRDRGPDQQRGRPEGRTAPRRNSEDVADAEVTAERAGLRQGRQAGERQGRSGDSSGPGSAADASGQGLEIGPGNGQHGSCPTTAGSGWWAAEPDIRRVADGIPARLYGGGI